MKNRFIIVLGSIVISASCSRGTDSAYCNSIASSASTNHVKVTRLYVYGTLQHGTIIISPECPRPVFNFGSIQIPKPGRDAAGKRIQEFNTTVYFRPGSKSGMFEFNGVVDVLPSEQLVSLVDVVDYHEVDEVESRQILDAVYASQKR